VAVRENCSAQTEGHSSIHFCHSEAFFDNQNTVSPINTSTSEGADLQSTSGQLKYVPNNSARAIGGLCMAAAAMIVVTE
jgi:hypothetical protein